MPRQNDIDRVRGLEKQLGLKAGECERTYGEADGERMIERIALPVAMAEELWNLRTLATVLIKKLDVALPQLDGIVGFNALRTGSNPYDGPNLEPEIEALREVLGLPKPAARPQEFFAPDYCKTCEGTGKVPGGDGIRDDFTRRNMRRLVTAVKDHERAVAWLLEIHGAEGRDEAEAKLSDLPLDIEHVGQRMGTVIPREGPSRRELVPAQTLPDADLSMFEIDVRRCDWDRPPEDRWKDICPECRGTGNRGLPVAHVGWDANGEQILATEVDD